MVIRFGCSLLLTCLVFMGCARPDAGILFTYKVAPQSKNFNRTSVGSKKCIVDEHRVREPVSGYGVTVEWSSDLIMTAAQKAGINEIYYTEMQTVSFLYGIYRRRRLIIYGD